MGASPQPNWEAFRQSMGYSVEELEVFRSHPNNVYVVENVSRLDKWLIVAEVIESHGCAAGHKLGDRLYFSPHGVLEMERNPARICLHIFPALAAALPTFQERIISGLDPNPNLFRRVGCLDVGVTCGGWGHVAFKLYAVPNTQPI
jgi:hypothetical protein